MIPCIRSVSELMAISKAADDLRYCTKKNKLYSSTEDSGQRKRYIRSIDQKEIGLPDIPNKSWTKWTSSKKAVSKFFDELDYNNQIQPSYDLTLIARQTKINNQDVAL